MRILLDTPVFLWAITEDSRLSHRHQTYYRDPASELYLSVAACWEILIMVGVKKLDLPSPASRFLMHQMEMNRIALLGVRAAHFEELEKLPPLHRDPFDRRMVAQARAESMPLMSVDSKLRKYKVKIL